MSDEPSLTVEQLATVLRVPVDMVREWQQQGILPLSTDDGSDGKHYCRRDVVRALREYPQIMADIKSAMRRGDAMRKDEEEDK